MEKEKEARKLNKQTGGQGEETGYPRLLGERLCLNYVNTIEARISEHPEDFLTSYSALVGWCQQTEIITQKEADQLNHQAGQQPDLADKVLGEALALREALYRIFVAVAHQQLPEPSDLKRLKQYYLHALQHADITPVSDFDKFGWVWQPEEETLDGLLWPVVESAVELLTSNDLQRVKQCPGWDDCGWLFFDTSKNRTRQWCSMEGCGSRVKMRKQYARKRPLPAMNN